LRRPPPGGTVCPSQRRRSVPFAEESTPQFSGSGGMRGTHHWAGPAQPLLMGREGSEGGAQPSCFSTSTPGTRPYTSGEPRLFPIGGRGRARDFRAVEFFEFVFCFCLPKKKLGVTNSIYHRRTSQGVGGVEPPTRRAAKGLAKKNNPRPPHVVRWFFCGFSCPDPPPAGGKQETQGGKACRPPGRRDPGTSPTTTQQRGHCGSRGACSLQGEFFRPNLGDSLVWGDADLRVVARGAQG